MPTTQQYCELQPAVKIAERERNVKPERVKTKGERRLEWKQAGASSSVFFGLGAVAFIAKSVTVVRINHSNENKLFLIKLFTKEFNNYPNYILGIEELANSKFTTAIDFISTLYYDTISLELTPDQSLIFTLKYKGNINVYIELFFSPKEGQKKDSFFAYYENKKCIYNGIGTIKEVVSDIEEIFKD